MLGVARSPSNTNSPAPRPTSIPSDILVHPAVWSQRTLTENWGLCPFRGRVPSNTMSPGPRPTSIPSGIFIHPAIWPQQIWAENWGGCAPLEEGELGPHLTQCRLGRGLPSYKVASSSIEPFSHNRHGPKIVGTGLHPFWGRKNWVPI